MRYEAAYQGSRGAFSEDAAIKLLSADAKLLACARLEDVFIAVTRGDASFGVVPIENTLAGSIHQCYDLLFEHDLKIVGETVCHIDHKLIAAPGVSLPDVRKVLSHPVALAQCEDFFQNHPEIEPVPVFDTAGAVENVIRNDLRDSAAIASARAARVYGGVILAEGLQDHRENYTRFLLIAPFRSAASRSIAGKCKTTIVFRIKNEPGALCQSLIPFAERRVDLAKLESRPIRGAPFEYLFYLDLVGDADSPAVSDAIAELRNQSVSLRVLGTYPNT